MHLNLKEVWSVLNLKEKKQIVYVTILQVFSGLFDMLGIVSIVPFLSLAVDPEIVNENNLLYTIKNWTNLNYNQLLVLSGVGSFLNF